MKKRVRIAVLASIAALFILALTGPPRARGFYDKVHRTIAAKALDLIDRTHGRNGVYGELLRHRERILEGAVAEDYGTVDGNERSMRHYYDPDARRPKKGVPYFAWYRLWQVKGAMVTPPPGGYYDGALDWARDGCGTGDNLNWAGAIRCYAGGTLLDTEEAYQRLGHVVHLLTDMTVYDHVVNIPHPGSYRKDLLGGKYGFEGFCESFLEDYVGQLNGRTISRFASLDEYFNRLARLTKAESEACGLLAPLGLKGVGIPLPGNLVVSVDEFNHLDIDYLVKLDIPWEPDIDVAKEGPFYTEYAVRLLNRAVEYCAGLMLDFCDIVRKPLYVRRISVSGQRGGLYNAYWEDEKSEDSDRLPRLASRKLIAGEDTPLDNRSPVKIEFDLDTNRLPLGDIVDPVSVLVKISGSDGKVIDKVAERVEGGSGGADGSTWRVTFVPELTPRVSEVEYRLEIFARDKAPRRGAPTPGAPLDSDPRTPLRVDDKPPYATRGHEPGPDKYHKFRVVRGSNSMIAMPAYILVRPTDEEGRAGELTIASYASEGDTTLGGPFPDAVDLYKTLCPLIDDLRQRRFMLGEMRVAVPLAYLEKCDIAGFGVAADWQKGVDANQKLKSTEAAEPPAKPAPEAPGPAAPAPRHPAPSSGLAGPKSLAEVPAVIQKMGFQVRKTGGCSHGTCYSTIIVNAQLAASFGFETGAVRLLGETFGGETTYDAVFWGELIGGDVTVWVDWLDKSYVPKERSFPSFLRLFEKGPRPWLVKAPPHVRARPLNGE